MTLLSRWKGTPTWGVGWVSPSSSPTFAIYLLEKHYQRRGKSPVLAIYKLFLSDQSQEFDKFLSFFNSFLDVHSAGSRLRPTSVFSKWKVLYGTYTTQVLQLLNLQFFSFKFSSVFVPVETAILGYFWVGFWSELLKMGYFTKIQTEAGVRDMKFPGVYQKKTV